jgi:hypothetical protein
MTGAVQKMMTDPVVLVATGDTFQRDSIRAWLARSRFAAKHPPLQKEVGDVADSSCSSFVN